MNRQAQILAVHAAFINEVVQCIQDPQRQGDFTQLMQSAKGQGWHELTAVMQKIKAGDRDRRLLDRLDEEDQIIAESILRGLQNPATLPDPNSRPDPSMAAPGLASMIHAAASGDAQALQLIANMAEQMSRAGGPMASLAATIRPLINGERNLDKLCHKMDTRAEQMVLNILRELKQLERI